MLERGEVCESSDVVPEAWRSRGHSLRSGIWLRADAEPRTRRITHVKFTSDGLAFTPREHAQLLGRLVEERDVAPDSYAIGGVVEELEQTFATLLKKNARFTCPRAPLRTISPSAPSHPTGVWRCRKSAICIRTLAIAFRHEQPPHDAARAGKGDLLARRLGAPPLGTQTGRVKTSVSVVSIETPVRRANGDISTPPPWMPSSGSPGGTDAADLDGARLFIQAAYTGQNVAAYADRSTRCTFALQVLQRAGRGDPRRSAALLDDMYRTRRMFGGSLAEAWPSVLIALHYTNGFNERFTKAVDAASPSPHSKATRDSRSPTFRTAQILRLEVPGSPATSSSARLMKRGVELLTPNATGRFTLVVNEFCLRRPALRRFTRSLCRSAQLTASPPRRPR